MKSLHEQMGGSYYLGKEHRIHQQIRKPNECQLQGDGSLPPPDQRHAKK